MALAPTTTDRGGETRRRILEVAAEAFAERGYTGTSLNDVLKASGVTKGGFYFHFPSKEALALATLRYKQEQWSGAVLAAVLSCPRALEQLHAMVEALCDLNEHDPACRAISRLCTELTA
jgi:TetR/AcrR family transcriptional repressor of nem operon